FIKNSISGLSAVWGVLLVVDAGEGVMPQTVEHLRVARSFGIKELLLAITKCDQADAQILRLAQEEALELLKREDMQAFGVYAVSSLTGQGLGALREGLGAYAERHIRTEKGLFRMYVDSAFSVKGYGTVVRGSCVSGELSEGDTLTLEPLGVVCRVRRMQNHGLFVKEGKAGERLALNIPELEPSKVERGHFLVKGLMASRRLIVRLSYAPKGRAFAFFGMREVSFTYRHLQEQVYLLRLSEPVPTARGEKGPVLNSSGELVGEYEVLHPIPVRSSKKFIKSHLHLLVDRPVEYLLLERGLRGLSTEELFSFFGSVLSLPPFPCAGNRLYHPQALEELSRKVQELLSQKEGLAPLSEVASRLGTSEELLKLVLQRLKHVKVVEGYLMDTSGVRPEELKGYRELLSFLSEGIKEGKELQAFGEYLRMALRKGQVYSLGDRLYVSRSYFEELVRRLKALGLSFSLQEAKGALGLSRKYLIPLLEHMDRLGLTRREGDRRVFLR
ncbi:MAG: selenocysteine-specific translation elongation factor, partial [Aquificaceae bacterium]|nr:selenocysteine-specific translation elongation factor [Aquificaceae bacterium]